MDVLGELIGLVFPLDCPGCGAARPRGARAACDGCLEVLTESRFGPALTGLGRVRAIAEYGPPLSGMIIAFKERGVTALAGPFGRALADLARPLASDSCWLVPVPSSAPSRRQRGYRPVELMVRVAAGRLRAAGAVTNVLAVLEHSRTVADQAGLNRAARAVNLQGAMRVRPRLAASLAARPVIVVDDIVTTGATLTEASRALLAAGARVRAAVVLAVADHPKN